MKGLIHVYTGNGKGKTTAAIGLIFRAFSHGLKVCYISFHKDPSKYPYGEIKILKKLKIDTFIFAKKHPHFCKFSKKNKINLQCKKAISFIINKIFKKNYDIIVIDEVLVSVRDKFTEINDLLNLIKEKPNNLELVLTGQSSKFILKKIKNFVDYITIFKKYKHPYDKGVIARKGIEF